jgi:hypothetical protein
VHSRHYPAYGGDRGNGGCKSSTSDDDIVAAIAPTIQRYLDGDIHPAASQESARSAAAGRADHRSGCGGGR